jgi:peptidyl-prolyl cis-trans isomerase A (cyclophilin A)
MSPLARVSCVVVLGAAVLSSSLFALEPRAPRAAQDLTKPEMFKETAPAEYLAKFEASFGTFVVRVTRDWAPNSADRFYNLVKAGYYNDNRFFRVIPKSLAQFGIHGDPAVSQAWTKATIRPDRARQSNTRGRVTFAMGSLSEAMSTQVFINFGDNTKMDLDGFAAFGQIITSLVIVERMFDQYGPGPDPQMLYKEGNPWLTKYMPQLDYIKQATIEPN